MIISSASLTRNRHSPSLLGPGQTLRHLGGEGERQAAAEEHIEEQRSELGSGSEDVAVS
jgi:hypothetical protein